MLRMSDLFDISNLKAVIANHEIKIASMAVAIDFLKETRRKLKDDLDVEREVNKYLEQDKEILQGEVNQLGERAVELRKIVNQLTQQNHQLQNDKRDLNVIIQYLENKLEL